jgi:aspartyl-tRNA(Asn)/glutamyl-tRNA(Gln) amidotransferase subunit A
VRRLLAKPAHELLDLIESGEIDPAELFHACSEWAKQADEQVNAFSSWDLDHPDSEYSVPTVSESPRQYRLLPYAAKDLFCTKGLDSTAGSRILKGYQPPYDATAIALLRSQHAQLLGKLKMDEFAMGSSGETCAWGATRNPWNSEYVPGGSSSGSAAAVAACQTPLALGTDTGGSIRQPASFCGVVGYRPTYGLISRYGMIAYSSSCDQAGVFARSSLDCSLAMNTLSQPDPMDSTCCVGAKPDYFADSKREVHWDKLRVGILRPFLDPGRIAPEVLDRYRSALETLSSNGAEITELDFDLADYCLPAYYIITAAECSSNLARYDGIRMGEEPRASELLERYVELRSRGFGAEVKRRILLGTYVLSAGYADKYYDRARMLRRDIAQLFAEFFKQVDVIATPTSPTLPFQFNARNLDPVQMYLSDLCTVFVNLAGLCGISLPCGMAQDSTGAELPVGLQFACAPFHDSLLLRLANQFEQLSGWQYTPPKWVQDGLGC